MTDTAEVLARRTQAVTLRAAGLSYAVIAARLGFAGPSGAWTTVMAALRENQSEAVDEMRLVENARLDGWTAALAQRCAQGDPRAIEASLKVSHRRAALNGLDAPRQIAVQMPLRADITDAIASLEESLALMPPDPATPDHLPETPGS